MPNPKQRKIALMGFRSVGKSSLAIQFVEGQFVDSYDPTIENTFNKKVNIKGHDYELLLIDTAGQDEYTPVPTEYSCGVHGYILVYSIDSHKSFRVCEVIYQKLLDLIGDHSVPIVLVGNKSDLHNERSVTTEEGKNLAEAMRATFVETSAKENQGVEAIFSQVVAEIDKTGGVEGTSEGKACIVM